MFLVQVVDLLWHVFDAMEQISFNVKKDLIMYVHENIHQCFFFRKKEHRKFTLQADQRLLDCLKQVNIFKQLN